MATNTDLSLKVDEALKVVEHLLFPTVISGDELNSVDELLKGLESVLDEEIVDDEVLARSNSLLVAESRVKRVLLLKGEVLDVAKLVLGLRVSGEQEEHRIKRLLSRKLLRHVCQSLSW
ncbi:hypothetical protein Klosneuvirus_6_14 [Klosneuvirus KNV1]|uniref:Uncharacterized protein n=1 Tax=Klosneuvirus KNV1 TaxID=1977640 RepID=A0A1V0SL57_9VIRU|nr:hypothetical protein Klosneuvirus_6_14 [Klosneuvirus KNV1]